MAQNPPPIIDRLTEEGRAGVAPGRISVIWAQWFQKLAVGIGNLPSLTGQGFLFGRPGNEFATRTIEGTTNEVDVTNGSGETGNPIIGLPTKISTPRQFGGAAYAEFDVDGKLNAPKVTADEAGFGDTQKTTIDTYGRVTACPGIAFTVTPGTALAAAEGVVRWNDQDHTLELCSEISGSILQVGQEMWVRGVNKTGTPILDGQVVYISGAQGNRPKLALAKADAEATSYLIGVATANIADNDEGYVTIFGLVRGYDTSGFTAGDQLYLSATTAGALTNVRPVAPNHGAFVATALNSTNNGSIFVHPDTGAELSELHDVKITSIADADFLVWDNAAKYWKNTKTAVALTLTGAFQALTGYFTGTTDSTSKDTGAVILEGGLGVEKNIYSGALVQGATGKFGAVAGGNFTEFETDGTLKCNGDATTWRDFQGTLFANNASPVIAVETDAYTASATGLTLTGTVGNTYLENGLFYIGQEQNAAPSTWDFTFRDLTKSSDIVYVWFAYVTGGGAAHNLKLQCYNNNTAAWVDVTAATSDFPAATGITKYVFNLSGLAGWGSGYYFDANSDLKLRFNHSSVGNTAHYQTLDKICIAREIHVPVLGTINGAGIRAPLFPGTDTKETAWSGSIEIDHTYKEGTNIYPHVHWMPTTAGAGNVKLYLEYTWINGLGTVTGSTTVYFTVSAGGTAWVEKRCNFDNSTGTSVWNGISGTGKTIGGRFFYRLYRNPNDADDTYADPIMIHDFQLHEEQDTLGSRGVTTK